MILPAGIHWFCDECGAALRDDHCPRCAPAAHADLINALHSFLAPGVTTWTMTSADLPALAQKINDPSLRSERTRP